MVYDLDGKVVVGVRRVQRFDSVRSPCYEGVVLSCPTHEEVPEDNWVQEDIVDVGLVYDIRLSLPERNVRDIRGKLALNTGEERVPDT